MWSRIKLLARHPKLILHRAQNARISTRITCLYAILILLVLLLSSAAAGIGVYYSFYHQAEMEINMSMERVLRLLNTGEPIGSRPWQEDPIILGVVVRVADENGRIVYENDNKYPPLDVIERHTLEKLPFWANKNMQVAEFHNIALYHARMDVEYGGSVYAIHFFKTITTEKHFIERLQKILFCMTMLGFWLSLIVGYFLSSRLLKPIRDMTATARKIEIEKMDRRLAVPEAKDELSELANTFNHMLDRLETGFKQQQQFVSDASHELRTPVTVILGYSDLISRWGRADKEILDESIEAIRSEAENMQQLIEKLLFLARADQKRQVLHKKNLEMADIVAEVMRKMELTTKTHSVELLENDTGTIYADEVTIKQMMRIFLENSTKYTPEGGHITASSKRSADGKFIYLTLADDGIGIAPENQEKVFERFYRVDSSRTKAEGGVSGTGLGLSIASWIAAEHGIEINLDSALGKGTKITLKIPLALAKAS